MRDTKPGQCQWITEQAMASFSIFNQMWCWTKNIQCAWHWKQVGAFVTAALARIIWLYHKSSLTCFKETSIVEGRYVWEENLTSDLIYNAISGKKISWSQPICIAIFITKDIKQTISGCQLQSAFHHFDGAPKALHKAAYSLTKQWVGAAMQGTALCCVVASN